MLQMLKAAAHEGASPAQHMPSHTGTHGPKPQPPHLVPPLQRGRRHGYAHGKQLRAVPLQAGTMHLMVGIFIKIYDARCAKAGRAVDVAPNG